MPEPAGEGGTTRAEINSLLSAMAADQTSEEKSAEALTDISEKVDQIADRVTGKKPKEEVEEEAMASAKNFVSLGDRIASALDGFAGKIESSITKIIPSGKTDVGGFVTFVLGSIGTALITAATVGSAAIIPTIISGLFGPSSFIGKAFSKTGFLGKFFTGPSGIITKLKGLKIFGGIVRFFDKIKAPFKAGGAIGKLFSGGGIFGKFFGILKRFSRFLKVIPIVGQIMVLIDGVVGFFKGLFGPEGDIFKAIQGAFASIIEGLTFGLVSFDDVMAFFGNLQEKLTSFFTSAFLFVDDTIMPFLSNLGESIGNFFTETLPNFFLTTIPNFIKRATLDAKLFFLSRFGGFFGVTLPTFLKKAMIRVKNFFTDTIPNAFLNLVDNVKILGFRFTQIISSAIASIMKFVNDKVPLFDVFGADTIASFDAAARGSEAAIGDIETEKFIRNKESRLKLEAELAEANRIADARLKGLETAIIQAEADANAERARQAAANAPSIVTAQTVNNSKTEVVSPGMSSMNPDIRAAQMAGGAAGMRGFAME